MFDIEYIGMRRDEGNASFGIQDGAGRTGHFASAASCKPAGRGRTVGPFPCCDGAVTQHASRHRALPTNDSPECGTAGQDEGRANLKLEPSAKHPQ